MNVPSPDRSRVRWHTGELDIRAEVVVTAGALEAVVTRNTRLDCYVIAGLEVLNLCACPDDCAGAFMTETVITVDDERANSSCVPEVDVRAEE